MSAHPPSQHVTIRRAAKALRVRRKFLRQLVATGRLPSRLYEGRPLIDLMAARTVLDRYR